MESFYIGIDVGTGSARACIINDDGKIMGIASKETRLWQPEPGHYEQSTSDIWNAICTSVRRVVVETPLIPPSQIRGIGIAATCSLAVFSGASSASSNKPGAVSVTGPHFESDDDERNVILWLDHRAGDETSMINSVKSDVLRYVGNKMSVEMELPKILWLKNNMPPKLFSTCKFFDLPDALTFLATGNETRSFCSTVCKQGYVPSNVDVASQEGWSTDFFNKIGLGEFEHHQFQAMGGHENFLKAGEFVGTLTNRAADELGLPAGIAVGSGVIDAYAGWIGTIGSKASTVGDKLHVRGRKGIEVAFNRIAAVAGTSTCHLAMLPQPVFVDGVWGPYRDVLIPEYFMAEGGQSATGELLKHVLETHPAFREAKSSAGKQSIYEFLNNRLRCLQEAKSAPSISYLGRFLFFYGDLWGNRSPLSDATMRGAYIGFDSDVSLNGLALKYHSALEFIALQTRQIIQSMNAAGHQIKSIFMSGSQCQNDILMSLISNACNMAIVIPSYETAAVVHGAAMLGVKASSAANINSWKGEGLWSIMERMSQPGKVVLPDNDVNLQRLLDVKYSIFLDMFKTQQSYRRQVREAIG